MLFLFNTDQLLFTPGLEVVPSSPQPAVIVTMIGDILGNGKVIDIFRETRRCCLENPTQDKVLKTGAQFLAETWPLLWKNFGY